MHLQLEASYIAIFTIYLNLVLQFHAPAESKLKYRLWLLFRANALFFLVIFSLMLELCHIHKSQHGYVSDKVIAAWLFIFP